jgi:conjugative relaxase-like TrwC/TraI family protein
MLRIHQIRSAGEAQSYYAQTDYYGQELIGNWGGKGAERLGLEGPVTLPAFNKLCDNLDPATGEKLTVRQKDNRTVGYDFNFNAPKGVSLLYALSGDERILEAFRAAVGDTLRELEQEAKTRVRKDGRYEDRVTGNLAWAEFVHKTARPVDGVSDPSLHAHMVVFNATHDPNEGRWKAAQFRWLKADAPYWEAGFHARLAGKLEALGYATERRGKHWDVACVGRPTVEKFSRRTALIEKVAAEEGIVAPEARAKLGQTTREKKDREQPWNELVDGWRTRLTSAERRSLEQARWQAGRPRPQRAGAEPAAVRHAAEHLFARRSVIGYRELLGEALRHGVGQVSVDGVRREAEKLDLIVQTAGPRLQATRQQVLAEEQRLVAVARAGRGTHARLGVKGGGGPHRSELSADQRKALDDLLASTDFITLFEAPAGTGKTRTATALRAAVEETGRAFVAVAPSAQASRGVLRDEGFQEADTLTMLLTNPRMQERARGGVIFLDEAGMVGVPTMLRLTDLARKLDARIVAAGDRRQHHAIERGDALVLLADEAKLPVARLTEIWRQKGEYRTAVERFQAGDAAGGLKKLDALGWVEEPDRGTLYERAADVYANWRAELIAGGKDPTRELLAVSPTNAEAARVTAAIRTRLKADGALGEERELLQLVPAHLTDAEKADRHSYQPGDVLQFQKAVPGVRQGQRIEVQGDEALPLAHPERFSVFRKGTLRLAVGEVIRPTTGGSTRDGHRLENGATYAVAGFTRGGDVCLSNGWVVSKNFGTWNHGYLSTSHSSQGRTVQRVLVVQSALSAPATSDTQAYVSVSRGKQRARVITDSRATLLEAVQRQDCRTSAIEFARRRPRLPLRQRLQRQVVRWRSLAASTRPVRPEIEPQRERGMAR